MNSKIMNIIAWIYTVLGVIASIVSGSKFEDIFPRLDVSAAIITIVGIINTLFFAAILFAIAKILEHTEYSSDKVASVELAVKRLSSGSENTPASNSKMNLSAAAGSSSNDGWRCPKCGKTNPSTSRVCKDCAYQK